MKLISIKVGPYRNILDSDTVQIDEQVTVLVGKNESGKTNLLHALHALNPANGSRSINRLDYPRWLQKKHKRAGTYQRAQPIEVTFHLTDEEKIEVASIYGENVLQSDEFCVYRIYESESCAYKLPECDATRAIHHLVPDANTDSITDIESLQQHLIEKKNESEDNGEQAQNTLNNSTILEKLSNIYNQNMTVEESIGQFLLDRMPKFFYFDEYAQLPGTTDIEPLRNALAQNQTFTLESDSGTALALLRMGYADDELIADNYDIRKAELQAVGAELTRSVLKYWKQNQHLRLMIDVHPVIENNHLGTQIVRRELKLDVQDDRHYFTNSLDARSSGFRWFVSFIAAFSEFEEDSNVIVLLDEPGLGLHARAQADFLRFIDERLASKHQVIFTTHSPFMIDSSHLERVRVVEDTGPDKGVKVAPANTASKDPDTLFPLQAALGYDIAQNLFVGPDNLVVEGLSDFTYLSVMSDHLKSIERNGLDRRWRILPAGGATNIPTFVALVGPSLDVTVIVDGGMYKNQRINNLIQKELLNIERLISPSLVSDVTDADIEDLFAEDDYLHLYNGAFASKIKAKDLEGSDRITKRLERNRPGFDHNAPANYLLHNRETVLGKLSDETLRRFEDLFDRINSTLADR
ncbi:MAG: AAA family ATPase [Acidimicrobiaceae bacterium]|nr:AAA family ATPase [Acidimicrobiaceae bacterium]